MGLQWISGVVQHFQSGWNEDKYWCRRNYCQEHRNLLATLYLVWLRRVEARMNASTGLGLNTAESPMCNIEDRLVLPHRLNNIIIARNVKIGRGTAIYQNVTIAESDKSKMTTISRNVMIGAGAVILNNVTVGNKAKIGANCVVISDILEGGVCVGVPGKVVKINS